jgi:large subunit ribosomal protein L25
MSKTIELNAELRNDIGKGASRRLRRLENLVPAVIYGGQKEHNALSISVNANELKKLMAHESFYTSVLHIHLGKKTETVIVKAIQRHPYKSQILHLDLQRVSANETIIKNVALHFINAEKSQGVKLGGLVSHILGEVEIECKVKDLPEFIEVDLSSLELDQILHLSDLKLPTHVTLTAHISDELHNLPVASIHMPKVVEEETAAPESAEVPTVAETTEEATEE